MGVVSRPAKSSLRSLLPLRSRLILVPGDRPGFREPFHCSWNISHIGRLGHVLPSVGQSLTGVEDKLGVITWENQSPVWAIKEHWEAGGLDDYVFPSSSPLYWEEWGVAGKGLWVRCRE